MRACSGFRKLTALAALTVILFLAPTGCTQWLTRNLPEHYEAHGVARIGSVAYAVTQLPGSQQLSDDNFKLVLLADGSCASLGISVARTGLNNYAVLEADLQRHRQRAEDFLADLCPLLHAADALPGKVTMEAVVVAKRVHVRRAERIGHPVRMRFYFSEEVASVTPSDRFDEMLATMAHEAFHLSLNPRLSR